MISQPLDNKKLTIVVQVDADSRLIDLSEHIDAHVAIDCKLFELGKTGIPGAIGWIESVPLN